MGFHVLRPPIALRSSLLGFLSKSHNPLLPGNFNKHLVGFFSFLNSLSAKLDFGNWLAIQSIRGEIPTNLFAKLSNASGKNKLRI